MYIQFPANNRTSYLPLPRVCVRILDYGGLPTQLSRLFTSPLSTAALMNLPLVTAVTFKRSI